MENKCTYCDYSGFEDHDDLLLNVIPMGPIQLRSSIWLSCNRTDVSNGVTPKLCTDIALVENCDGDEIVNTCRTIDIRFCPICGRNLLEKE